MIEPPARNPSPLRRFLGWLAREIRDQGKRANDPDEELPGDR